jgi:hypothetical protein
MPYITPDGSYYDGSDNVAAGSIEVPARPSHLYDWDGAQWVINAERQAHENRLNLDLAETLNGKNDAAIIALLDNTRAEWVTWVTANLPSIGTAPERNKMAVLFWLVAMCARKLLR